MGKNKNDKKVQKQIKKFKKLGFGPVIVGKGVNKPREMEGELTDYVGPSSFNMVVQYYAHTDDCPELVDDKWESYFEGTVDQAIAKVKEVREDLRHEGYFPFYADVLVGDTPIEVYSWGQPL